MSRPTHTPDPDAQVVSLEPKQGWHCSHLYYRFDRAALTQLSTEQITTGRKQFIDALNPEKEGTAARLQTSIVSGQKADFGLMVMDPNPLVVDQVHQQLLSGTLGPALEQTYSFTSITEISEYVPSLEQYAQRLIAEGEEKGSATYTAKMKAYEGRQPVMKKQRLTPDLPPWPNTCFYPMNKKRKVGENWFLMDFDQRNKLMAEHARSGMRYAGKVTQLISVALGFDDWEWGVTLWARRPEFLKDIVYEMRFDEASARYAEFGPFYTSYITTAEAVLEHCLEAGK